MRYWIFFVMWWAGRSFFFLAAIWCAMMLRKKQTESGAKELTTSCPKMNDVSIPEVQPRGRQTVYIATMALLAGLGIGYEGRDLQMRNRLRTYTDVSVLTKYADKDFSILPARMKQQHIQICPESVVDWREGEVLDDWTFEQEQGCKRVISYHEKPKGELNAAIQIR